jgi:hypothetical protein
MPIVLRNSKVLNPLPLKKKCFLKKELTFQEIQKENYNGPKPFKLVNTLNFPKKLKCCGNICECSDKCCKCSDKRPNNTIYYRHFNSNVTILTKTSRHNDYCPTCKIRNTHT